MVVMGIIGVLLTLFSPELGTMRERAEKVVCMGHLRSLHAALGAYLTDNEQWPQYPTDANGDEIELSQEQDEQFWFDALTDYGITQKDWQCPTLTRQLGLTSGTSDAIKIHYTPTNFDDNPLTPRKWPGMPWLVEVADVHHGGCLMIRTDGAVLTVDAALRESSN